MRYFKIPNINQKSRIHTRKKVNIPKPCNDLAWVLGSTCGDGYVNNRGLFCLTTVTKRFSLKYLKTCQKLFQIKGKIKIIKPKKKHWQNVFVTKFYSITLTEFLGDLRSEPKSIWPSTIKEKHSWVLKEESYIFYFLLGFFDAEGYVYFVKNRNYALLWAVPNSKGKEFISDLMKSVGFKSRIHNQGVGLTSVKEIQKFINKSPFFKSCIPHRQERIDKLIEYQRKKWGDPFICDYCHKEDRKRRSRLSKFKNSFCSKKCFNNFSKKGKLISCLNCKNIFYRQRNHIVKNKQNFCSRKCVSQYKRSNSLVKCNFCLNLVYKPPSYIKKAKFHFCSNECHYNYLKSFKKKSIAL